MIEAVEESAVDCFTLKPSNPLIGCGLIAGQIKTCNKEFIFVEITERDHCMYLSKHPDRCYDIFFHVNRVTFQLQHYALEWIANHQLFNIFVNSSDYDCDASNFNVRAEPPDTEENYAFRLVYFSIPSKEELIWIENESILLTMKIQNGSQFTIRLLFGSIVSTYISIHI